MNEEHFLIQFIPSKHCFLQFSNKWFQKINNPKCSCIKLVHPTTKQELRFTCAPQPSFGLNDCSVGINATFALGLNLHEGELVVISGEEVVTPLRQVFLTPSSADDYEILEMSRDNVEVSLLNQIRVVYVQQVVTVWVTKTLQLKLTVDKLEPNSLYGRLEPLTELVIEEVTNSKSAGIKAQTNSHYTSVDNAFPSVSYTKQDLVRSSEPSLWGLLSDYLPNRLLDLLKPRESNRTEPNYQIIDNTQLTCRVHPIPSVGEPVACCNDFHHDTLHPFNVFVDTATLQKDTGWPCDTFISILLKSQASVAVCRLESVGFRKSKNSATSVKNSEETESEKVVSVVVRLYRIDESCQVFNKRTGVSCVYISRFLRCLLNLRVGSKVSLTAYNPPVNTLLTDIMLHPATNLSESETADVRQLFIDRLPTRGGVLVNNYCPLSVPRADGSECLVLVQLSPEQLDCWPLTRPELQVCSLTVATVGEESLANYKNYDKEVETVSRVTSVFEQLVQEGVETLEIGQRLTDAEHQDLILDNILIIGKHGSGKSRLAEAIYTAVAGPPHHVHVGVVDCRPLKGKKPESIAKVIAEQLEECIYFQPSVLVLEDLPCIAGAPTNDLEPSQEAYYFLRISTILKELLWRVRVSQCVSVIATAESRSQIHPQLLSARGRHTFTTVLNIPALDKNHRLKILTELLNTKTQLHEKLDLEDLAKKTEGCSAQDLSLLVDRVVFKACQRQTRAELLVESVDVESALEGFVPSDLLNVSLVRHTSHSFAEVGGLTKAKELLTEVLIWPTKYPEVFSQCPLRLERGALLYGAPGTGKTLLANAVVGESGLNLITVKGPELLSKYIGASEEAVRNVFQKAQSAQPCILFFDEFDSLAPRRGHDSTGVTDRVVNQLLTQMDGVEALEGVWVVAAASRPDLLDPALLRPGRIGTLIHCPLPDEEERVAILQSLSNKLRLSNGVDLTVVAAKTRGFTGADLQAVLFTAQMTAFEALSQDSDEEMQVKATSVSDVAISQDDLLVALESTAPSLKPEDRLRFELIYERFKGSGDGTSQRSPEETNQKVTLA